MDVKNFADELKKKSNEVETLMKRKLPVIVGRMAKDHYQENFRKGGATMPHPNLSQKYC